MIDATRSTHNQEIINSYITGYNKGKLDSKIKFIEKACEWFLRQEEMIGISFENDFIERFKKAMEE